MFLLHYTCGVLRSRNSRKAFKFLSKCLVLLLYGNQYRNLCFVHKTTYLWSMSGPGGGELSLFACPGVGNGPPSENKIANPRGNARAGMVTGRIEPCITELNCCHMWISVLPEFTPFIDFQNNPRRARGALSHLSRLSHFPREGCKESLVESDVEEHRPKRFKTIEISISINSITVTSFSLRVIRMTK